MLPPTESLSDCCPQPSIAVRRLPRILCLAGFLWLSAYTVYADESAVAPQTWAILIGAEKYEKATPLEFTANDVRQLANTLITHGGLASQRILQITDLRSETAFQPRSASLREKLPQWLSKPGPQDSVVLYFSGHGFRAPDGKLYLAPVDCDPANPTEAGLPVEWLRNQLADCKAGFKLLILDACHAGTEKGLGESVDGNALGATFEDLERVVTIASCKANQKSVIWPAKEQSLFSYWLNQGLRGHADREPDGRVDIDELYEFVSRNVKRTADFKFGREQTPVRIIRAGTDGVPVVVNLQPQPLKAMLADMAEQIAYSLEERKLGKVGVPEFIALTPDGREGLGGPYGLLGKYCAEELERQLQDRGAGKFSVVDRRRLQDALSQTHFQLQDLGSTQSLASLSKSAGGLPVLAVGTILSRDGRLLRLQCKLQQTGDDTELGVRTGGTAGLNENEWAMLGRSAVVRVEDRFPTNVSTTSNSGASTAGNVEAQLISRVDERAESPRSHPYQDPTFPFRITLVVNNQPRPGEFRGNDYFVPVTKGEKYTLVVENRSGETAVMRLLVDGLNTLPEKESAKGVVLESWGQHVSLDSARAWVLDPSDAKLRGGEPKWTVQGFATATGKAGIFREFVVVDAQDSLAARQSYNDQIGLITAAFYKPKAGARGGGLGTAAGGEIAADLTERTNITAGSLIGVVHIRYVDRQALVNTR